MLFRSEKMSLYANDVFTLGDGVRLGSLGETKVDSRYANLLFPKNGKDILEENEIKITKEDDRLVFSGRFKKNDKVKLIVDNVFRTKVYNMTISKRPYTAMCIDIFNEEETENGIVVTKYVNSEGLSGKYYLYVSINGRVYDLEKYLYF